MAEELIGHFGYFGIALILILGGLGLPIPEEAAIILAAVLTRNGRMSALPAIASCLVGVLLGDFVVYLLGYCYGEKVLRFPLTRRFLTREREAQIKGYLHRHGFKILVSGRLVPGFRTAAYLTAGILRLPTLKLLITDLVAVTMSTALMFGLGFLFADQIQKGIHEVQQWLVVAVAAGIVGWILYRYERARRLAGKVIGPPVLVADEAPLPAPEPEASGPAAAVAAVPGCAEGPSGRRSGVAVDARGGGARSMGEGPVEMGLAPPAPQSSAVQSPSR